MPFSPFKNKMGTLLLRDLFFEWGSAGAPLYTLKSQDHQGCRSLYRLYLETDDPTEYVFATTYFDGWEHWTTLCKTKWFKPYVDKWRKELEIRIRAKALQSLRDVANTPGGKETFQANKFLLSGHWKGTETPSTRGRPTKDDIATAADQIATEEKRLEEDYSRIQGTVQ